MASNIMGKFMKKKRYFKKCKTMFILKSFASFKSNLPKTFFQDTHTFLRLGELNLKFKTDWRAVSHKKTILQEFKTNVILLLPFWQKK